MISALLLLQYFNCPQWGIGEEYSQRSEATIQVIRYQWIKERGWENEHIEKMPEMQLGTENGPEWYTVLQCLRLLDQKRYCKGWFHNDLLIRWNMQKISQRLCRKCRTRLKKVMMGSNTFLYCRKCGRMTSLPWRLLENNELAPELLFIILRKV